MQPQNSDFAHESQLVDSAEDYWADNLFETAGSSMAYNRPSLDALDIPAIDTC